MNLYEHPHSVLYIDSILARFFFPINPSLTILPWIKTTMHRDNHVAKLKKKKRKKKLFHLHISDIIIYLIG